MGGKSYLFNDECVSPSCGLVVCRHSGVTLLLRVDPLGLPMGKLESGSSMTYQTANNGNKQQIMVTVPPPSSRLFIVVEIGNSISFVFPLNTTRALDNEKWPQLRILVLDRAHSTFFIEVCTIILHL